MRNLTGCYIADLSGWLMRIRVREASKADAKILSKLVADFWDEHSRMLGGRATPAPTGALSRVRGYLVGENTGYLVALDSDNRRLGFRRWEYVDGFYFPRELYVVPGMRGRGAARELIRRFEEWLKDKGQDIACISCTPHNAAMISLARSEGYRILNTIEMRKNLTGDQPQPKAEREALGFTWKVP